jgi:probable F420-dependent oxidoreductase
MTGFFIFYLETDMKIGVVFPQTEFGHDPMAVRDYAQTAESLGFTHVLAYDHVLGANPDRPGGWRGPYTYQHPFLDPFVLFSYMAAVTTKLEFITGVLILPQRETAVVAKQAATFDVLSNGRFRLGIGTGWNEVEYIGLNQDFHTRGKRQEEQIELLRKLWTEELVVFNGRWHTIPDAGINPLPIQRPIPIWLGGHAEAVLKRIGKMGDGWIPGYRTAAAAQASLAKLDGYLEENGRSRHDIGIEASLRYRDSTPQDWHTILTDWQAAGATHASLNTMGAGLSAPQDHLNALQHFAQNILTP